MNLEKISQYEAILDAIRSILRNPEYSGQFRSDLESVLQEGETTLDIVSKRVSDLHVTMNRNPLIIEAESLYKDFPIEKVRNELIEDYISMEMASRRGDLKYYFLALYQQFENLTNATFELNKEMYYKFYEENKTNLVNTSNGNVSLQQLITNPYNNVQYSNINTHTKNVFKNVKEKFLIICYQNNPNSGLEDMQSFITKISDVRNPATHRYSNYGEQLNAFQEATEKPIHFKLKFLDQLQIFVNLTLSKLNSEIIEKKKQLNQQRYCYIPMPKLVENYKIRINWNSIHFDHQNNIEKIECLLANNKSTWIKFHNNLIEELTRRNEIKELEQIIEFIKEFCSLYICYDEKTENSWNGIQLNKELKSNYEEQKPNSRFLLRNEEELITIFEQKIKPKYDY